jgi:uncharacterized protein
LIKETEQGIYVNTQHSPFVQCVSPRLFTEKDRTVIFHINNVIFDSINPCQRCVLPTRDSRTGKAYTYFQKILITKRQDSLPNWIATYRFNHL